jgi:hypothetical protein
MVEFPACALGKLAVGGDLSVTRVERSVTLDPNEAIPGPEYGEPVVHTDTHEVRLVFPGARLPAAQNGAIQLSPLVWRGRNSWEETRCCSERTEPQRLATMGTPEILDTFHAPRLFAEHRPMMESSAASSA